jgi:hypothetical protein
VGGAAGNPPVVAKAAPPEDMAFAVERRQMAMAFSAAAAVTRAALTADVVDCTLFTGTAGAPVPVNVAATPSTLLAASCSAAGSTWIDAIHPI